MCCRNSKHLWTYLSLKSVSCLKNAQTSVYAKRGREDCSILGNEEKRKHIQKTGEDPIETVILDDNESTERVGRCGGTKVWVFWNYLRIRLLAVHQLSVVIFISSFSGGVE